MIASLHIRLAISMDTDPYFRVVGHTYKAGCCSYGADAPIPQLEEYPVILALSGNYTHMS